MVTVTATSQADATQSATATVSLSPAQCISSGYSYLRAITIDHTKVPNTDQASFPVLISGTYPFLATVANGGRLQNSNGYDIVFTSDLVGKNILDYEIDSYNPGTGTAAYWVRIPTLSHTMNTTIYMWYGNNAVVASQENKQGVWQNGYLSVYHYGNGSTVGLGDSGSAGYTLAGSATAVTGEIGGGAGFNVNIGNDLYYESVGAYPSGSSPVTLETWVQLGPVVLPFVQEILGYGSNTWSGSRAGLAWDGGNTSMDFENMGVEGPMPADNNWHHLVGVYGGGALTSTTNLLYLDGALIASGGTGLPDITTDEFKIGGMPQVAWGYCCNLNGSVDETRISSVARPTDWITTEYNNESSPSTFYAISQENNVLVNPVSVTLESSGSQHFTASQWSNCSFSAIWSQSPIGLGTLTPGGLYTAPAELSTQETVTITATSETDTTMSASATVTLIPPVAVSVTPNSATLYNGSQPQQFTANVTNAIDTAVAWTISPIGAGTINPSGLYMAPAGIAGQETVTITATSQFDTTKSASATITLLPPTLSPPCGSNGYSYRRAIVVDHTQVPNTDQSNFPFLFNTTDPAFATTANGGHVTSFNGYDIIFSTDPNGLTKLNHEIEEYNPLSGQVIAWVQIPTLSHTSDTVLYVFYGNESISSSQQNPTGVWDRNYQAVYHLANSSAGLAIDSTSNGNNAPLISVSSASGEIDGGAGFTGASYMQVPSPVFATYPTSGATSTGFSASFGTWFRTASPGVILGQTSGGNPGGSPSGFVPAVYIDNAGSLRAEMFYHSGGTGQIIPPTAYNDNQWHFVEDTYANGTETLYVDGQNEGSQVVSEESYSAVYSYYVGTGLTDNWPQANTWLYFNGALDEVHISSTARSADWVRTEYNNQSLPSNFYALYPENAERVVPFAVSLYALQSQQFTAPASVVAMCSTNAVVWSMPPNTPGTLTAGGLYTAPASIDTEQTITIIATTLGNGSATYSATVTLMPPVSVSVTPSNATLTDNQTQQFSASVVNTSHAAVSWTIIPAGTGTISAAGLYTAPTNITGQETVTIMATSQAVPALSASASIMLSPTAVAITPPSTQCGSSGYSFQRTIVIDHTKVPNTDQNNFPFLFNTIDPSLATTTNGGQVTSSSGYDIIFSTDPNGATKLDHELEEYNPVTGQVIAWVRIPTLSHSSDTVLYVFYGNPNVTASQQNPTGVWNSNFLGVYHLANVGTGTATDSTANANSGTLSSVLAAPGEIDGAGVFNGTSSYIQIPGTDFPNYPNGSYADIGEANNLVSTTFTASFGTWFKTASSGGILGQVPNQSCTDYFFGFCLFTGNTEPGYVMPFGWESMLYVNDNGNLEGFGITTAKAYNDNTWHYVVATYATDGTDVLYVDGQNVGSAQQVYPVGYSSAYSYFVGTS
jgi:hypothetical protein